MCRSRRNPPGEFRECSTSSKSSLFKDETVDRWYENDDIDDTEYHEESSLYSDHDDDDVSSEFKWDPFESFDWESWTP